MKKNKQAKGLLGPGRWLNSKAGLPKMDFSGHNFQHQESILEVQPGTYPRVVTDVVGFKPRGCWTSCRTEQTAETAAVYRVAAVHRYHGRVRWGACKSARVYLPRTVIDAAVDRIGGSMVLLGRACCRRLRLERRYGFS